MVPISPRVAADSPLADDSATPNLVRRGQGLAVRRGEWRASVGHGVNLVAWALDR